jgi:hypothetical protein
MNHNPNQNSNFNFYHNFNFNFNFDYNPNIDSFSREDRFVHYRNYILDYVRSLSHPGSGSDSGYRSAFADIDWWLMLDFDVQAIDWRHILHEFGLAIELFDVDIFCVNGMEWNGRYRDSFATIFEDDEWCYEQGYKCHRVLQLNRFTKLRSCFGGLAIYKFDLIINQHNHNRDHYRGQISDGCRYQLLTDLRLQSRITYEWFKQQTHQSKICEHIAFHDCLSVEFRENNYNNNNNITILMSRDSHLYYGCDTQQVDIQEWKEEPILFGTA